MGAGYAAFELSAVQGAGQLIGFLFEVEAEVSGGAEEVGGDEPAAGEGLGGLCGEGLGGGDDCREEEQSCGCDALHVGSQKDQRDVRWGSRVHDSRGGFGSVVKWDEVSWGCG